VLAIRLAKISCVAALALYIALVAFGNITDYGTNFVFVAHVLDMDQILPRSDIRWRAVASPLLHHAFYILIIAAESAVAGLAAAGAVAMLRRLRDEALAFHRAKSIAVAGLTLGFLLYEVGFIAIGGEWFGMWQAPESQGAASAFRIVMTMLGALIFISLKDEELA
jgi:predicted small integral membrane protein